MSRKKKPSQSQKTKGKRMPEDAKAEEQKPEENKEPKPGDPHPERAPEIVADPPPEEPGQTPSPMPPHPLVAQSLNPTPVPAPPAPGTADLQTKLAELERAQNQPVELPDGSMRVSVIVPAEMVPVIKDWAEGAGEPFDEYLVKHVNTCLNAGTMAGHTW